MQKRDELISDPNIDSKIYSIYFNTGGGNKPVYGLKQISSGDGYYYSANTNNELLEKFKEIANKIKKVDVAIGTQTSTGKITLEEVTKISAIKVGDNPISDAELQNIKNAIMSNAYYDAGEDKGPLDLNDFAYIFCTNEKITIVY